MGREARELLGKDVLELAGTPEDLCFWGEVASGLADEIESDTLVRRAGAGTVAVTRRVRRIEDTDGAALYVVALHDRSAQLRIERALDGTVADLRATFESTRDGILVTDLAGRIRHFNQRFAQLWQMPPGLLGRRDDAAVHAWMRRNAADAETGPPGTAAVDVGAGRSPGGDQAARRHGARTGDDSAAHARPADRPGGFVSRHHRAARSEPAHPGPVAHRRADRAAEPPPARRPRRGRTGAGPPRRHAVRAAVPQPRPLQPHQ